MSSAEFSPRPAEPIREFIDLGDDELGYYENGTLRVVSRQQIMPPESPASMPFLSDMSSPGGVIKFEGTANDILRFIHGVRPAEQQRPAQPAFTIVPTPTAASVIGLDDKKQEESLRKEQDRINTPTLSPSLQPVAEATDPGVKKIYKHEHGPTINLALFTGRALAVTAIVGAIVSGPVYQMSRSDSEAMQVCATKGVTSLVSNANCFIGEYTSGFSLKNLFNYTSVNRK